jgi:hypothetical protein
LGVFETVDKVIIQVSWLTCRKLDMIIFRFLPARQKGQENSVTFYPISIANSLPGPCMPLNGVACMSAVELGPVMRTSWLGMAEVDPM